MQQRVFIARALMLETDLLLLDETFGFLDALTRDELNIELSRIWRKYRKTSIFITQNISKAILPGNRRVVVSHPWDQSTCPVP